MRWRCSGSRTDQENPVKALVLKALNKLELDDVSIPQVRPDQMLVRTGAATICTSDIHDLHANPFGIQLPVTLGHEGAGTVAAVGANVTGFKPGDSVATHPVHPCRKCQVCKGGLEHLCPDMEHFGLNLPGTFAEYYLVRQDRARHIPDHVPFHVAALAEPVSVCLEALNQARLQPGQNLLILGDGPFGVLMTRLARDRSLGKVAIAGWLDSRLAYAHTETHLNTSHLPDPVSVMLSPLDGSRYDAAILAVSSAQAFQDGLHCLKPRGRMVVFSALPDQTRVDLFSLHLKELEVVGACGDHDLFDQAVSLLDNPRLALDELVTHEFPLEDYHQAFETAELNKAEAMKVAFRLDGENYG